MLNLVDGLSEVVDEAFMGRKQRCRDGCSGIDLGVALEFRNLIKQQPGRTSNQATRSKVAC